MSMTVPSVQSRRVHGVKLCSLQAEKRYRKLEEEFTLYRQHQAKTPQVRVFEFDIFPYTASVITMHDAIFSRRGLGRAATASLHKPFRDVTVGCSDSLSLKFPTDT